MEKEDTGGIPIDVVIVGLSVVFMMVFSCWMNHIPSTLYQVARSWLQSFCGFNRGTTGPNSNQVSPHLPSNDINQIAMFESMDDVQQFLAELRRSARTQPNMNISNLTRYEFITNLIITKKVEATTSNDQGMSCAICLGDYQPGDIMCSSHNAKCNHQFHQICIYRWLLQNRDDCPCCRNNYLTLSDANDRTPTPDPSPSSSTDITSDVENVTENPPSTNTVEEMALIPSSLAPFPPPRPTVETGEVENEHSGGPINPSSSSLESLTVASGGNHDDGSQTDDLDQPDDAEVSKCPSVDDVDQEHGSNHYDERHGFF